MESVPPRPGIKCPVRGNPSLQFVGTKSDRRIVLPSVQTAVLLLEQTTDPLSEQTAELASAQTAGLFSEQTCVDRCEGYNLIKWVFKHTHTHVSLTQT